MAGRQIRISIMSALNAAGIEATREQVARMADSVSRAMGKAASNNRHHWADIKAAWDMGVGAIKKVASAAASVLKSAFHFETQTTQFKTLIGNIDAARAHMADLKELGDTPPFSLDEFAKASRSLMVMTNGALGYKKSLEMIGDAAAATGQPIEEMGHVVGRLYALIRDGEPVGRAALQLQNMGVITPEVTEQLKEMQKAEKSNAEIWAVVEEQLGRYSGAMKETEKTGEGMMGAIKSRWDSIVRAFGQALEGTAKNGMGKILDAAKDLEENGTLEVWASKVGEAVAKVVEAIGVAVKMAGKLADAYHWVQDKSAQIGASIGGFVGTLAGGGSLKDAANAAGTSWTEEGRYRADLRKDEAKKEEEIKKAVVRRVAEEKAKKEAEVEKRSEAERLRIQESLANAQKKIDEKLAKEHEKEQKKRDDAKLRRDIARQHKLLAEAQKEESKASRDLTAAEAKRKEAWGWYRDRRSMAAQLREERADAKAQAQYEKDFARLSRHRNWREATNLSVRDEAVRRVALAKEEEAAAKKAALETAENTKKAAEKLQELSDTLEKSLEVS